VSRVAAVAVVVLLLLSGCAGVLSDEPTDTLVTDERTEQTDVPRVTSTSGAAATPANVEYPPGFSPTGITTRVVRNRTTRLLRNGPVVVSALERFRPGAYADYRYAANTTHARFRLTVHNGYSDITEQDRYANSTGRYSRIDRNDRTVFDASNGTADETKSLSARRTWPVLSRILTFGEFRASESYRADGELRIRYELTGTIFENATDERGYLLVGGDGIVREAGMAYTRSGDPKRFEYAVLRRSDVRVESPPWLSAAVEGR
jgi:hypothetical protein